MISSPYYLLSILSRTLLAFFTVAFAVEILLKILHVKNFKMRLFLRSLPFVSLIIDLMFEKYSIAYWINPLSCASCVQKFMLEVFFPQLQEHLSINHISLMHYLSVTYQHILFSTLFFAFIALTLFFGARKLIHTFALSRLLRTLEKDGTIYEPQLENVELIQMLKYNNVKVIVSPAIQIPFATYSKRIMLPQNMIEIFDTQELEAVLAHELEHIKNGDPLKRWIFQFIATLFWWVPTSVWIRKIEQDQEIASDQSIQQYGCNNTSLASAIVKATKQNVMRQELCYLDDNKHPALNRIHRILGYTPLFEENISSLNLLGVIFGTALLLSCLMWL